MARLLIGASKLRVSCFCNYAITIRVRMAPSAEQIKRVLRLVPVRDEINIRGMLGCLGGHTCSEADHV